MLLSRTQSKLQEAAQLIAQRHSVETSVFAMDLARAKPEQWSNLAAQLEPLDIGILVNNCGLSYPHAEFFDKLDEQHAADIVVVNISALNAVSCPAGLSQSHSAPQSSGSLAVSHVVMHTWSRGCETLVCRDCIASSLIELQLSDAS